MRFVKAETINPDPLVMKTVWVYAVFGRTYVAFNYLMSKFQTFMPYDPFDIKSRLPAIVGFKTIAFLDTLFISNYQHPLINYLDKRGSVL